VAYAQGNTRPTLTDANIVLGRINAERPIGGALKRLDVEAARAALEAHVGQPLGLSPEQAAEAVVRVANAKMAGAIRLVSIERGHDPSRFTALPFGGGGALHVGALITEVGLKSALVPRYPGITSALGCIIADIRHDKVMTVNLMLDALDARALGFRMAEAGFETRAQVAGSGLDVSSITVSFELDMHYLGQTHTVAVPLPIAGEEEASGVNVEMIAAAFEAAYSRAFSRLLPGTPVKIVNLRATAIGARPAFDLTALAPKEGDMAGASRGARPVWFGGAWHEAAIWDRLALPVGADIKGPAVLEQDDATTVIDPGLAARVDVFGNLVVERG
jgi:N-methylhydantoinase A